MNVAGRARSPNAPTDAAHGCGGFGETALPIRKHLPHDIPSWVSESTVFFITVNCMPRGVNQLAHAKLANPIETSILHYQSLSKWWIHLLVVMPDHLHGLISFGRDVVMRRVVADWKRYLARECGISWQRDFFDHRIRDADSLTEKWHYICHNPVRKQLTLSPDDWPYRWQNGQPRDITIGRARSPNAPTDAAHSSGGFGETALPSQKQDVAGPGRARSPNAPLPEREGV